MILDNNYLNAFYKNHLYLTMINLAVMFLGAILTRNGNVIFVIWFFSSFLILAIYKSIKYLVPYYLALLINNALAEYSISLLRGITVTGLIKIFFLIWFIISFRRFRKKDAVISLSFFLVWVVYFFINSLLNHVNGAVDVVLTVFFPMTICLMTQKCACDNDKCFDNAFLSGIVAALVNMVFIGFLELIINKTFFYSAWTGSERYRYGIIRIGTTTSDPNFACLTELFIIILINSPVFSQKMKKDKRYILTILVIAQILLLSSRTGLVSLAIVIFIFLFKYNRNISIISLPILGVVTVELVKYISKSLSTVNSESYSSRMRILELALDMWRKKPIIGTGYRGFYNLSSGLLGLTRSTMNEYVSQLVNYGIIGLVLYLSFLLLVIRKTSISINNILMKEKSEEAYFFAAIVVWIIMGFSLDIFSKMLIWFIPALYIIGKNNKVVAHE